MGLRAWRAASVIKGLADGIDAVGTERRCLGDAFAWDGGGVVCPSPSFACLPLSLEPRSDPHINEVRSWKGS